MWFLKCDCLIQEEYFPCCCWLGIGTVNTCVSVRVGWAEINMEFFLITLNLMFEMESFTEPPVRGLLAWLTALWGLPVIAPQHWGSCTHTHTLLFVVILCGC